MNGVVVVDLRRNGKKRRAHMTAAAKRRARAILMWAQDGICAHCEEPFPKHYDPQAADAPTIEHVEPRARGGGNELSNLLLKHQACNVACGCQPPSKRDRKWQKLVATKLAGRDLKEIIG